MNRHTLSKNLTTIKLKEYGFRHMGNDYYSYRILGYNTIYIYFTIGFEDRTFVYDVKCEDGTIYHPFYSNDTTNHVRHTIKNILETEINKMIKKGIIN